MAWRRSRRGNSPAVAAVILAEIVVPLWSARAFPDSRYQWRSKKKNGLAFQDAYGRALASAPPAAAGALVVCILPRPHASQCGSIE
jgi:hypothetical protein